MLFGKDTIGRATINGLNIDPISSATESILSTILLQDTMDHSLLPFWADSIIFGSDFTSVLVQHQYELNDTIELTDATRVQIRLALSDLFQLQDTVSVHAALETILDTLGLEDQFDWISQSTQSFLSSFGLTDTVSFLHRLELSDTFVLADQILLRFRLLKEILDTIQLTDSLSSSYLWLGGFEDSIHLSDSLDWTIQQVLELSDEIALAGFVSIDGERYLVWGLNPRTAAAFKWTFAKKWNSFARVGGKNLLCADDGIYELTGTTDGGATIPAYLRTGLVDFNDPERHYDGAQLKQLLSAYLVMTAEGETLLKVRTSRTGTMQEVWFKCLKKPEVVSKVQVPLSNTLRSVLFQFELKPLGGKPAKYKAVEIVPLFLTRAV